MGGPNAHGGRYQRRRDAALCCVAPFLVAGLVTALGLGFILNDALLMSLLVLFIGVAALGYYFVQRQTCA